MAMVIQMQAEYVEELGLIFEQKLY